MDKFVTLREFTDDRAATRPRVGEASASIVLQSLQEPSTWARIDTFASEEAAQATGGEVYRVLLTVAGSWSESPSHAVLAVWELKDPDHAAAFIDSRQQLFVVRQRVLPTFSADWLLAHRGHPGRYMVLGFYGDEDGATRLCREHPAIKQFAQAHPASQYTAQDLSGLRCWRVQSLGDGTGKD